MSSGQPSIEVLYEAAQQVRLIEQGDLVGLESRLDAASYPGHPGIDVAE